VPEAPAPAPLPSAAAAGYDALVVGSGVAGLTTALALSRAGRRVALLTKGALGDSTTSWSQGGIAAALGADDSPAMHLADTLKAGAGLCDEQAAEALVFEGPRRVEQLIADGAVLDRDAAGSLERAREGGHTTARVVHAGGAATGAEVQRTLVAAARAAGVEVLADLQAVDLIAGRAGVEGVSVLGGPGSPGELRARDVVLATGGFGNLFATTTNPAGATGDGAAMALRAGVPVADLEFVQFHPTALAVPSWPRPLLSEALRGEGAVLRDAKGRRFVDELASRDVVSRAIAAQLAESGADHVLLDATAIDGFAARFPTLAAVLAGAGLDPARDWLPVAPAAHYCCGGVLTDLDGASALAGLWAVGEAACTGAQGANRLASNSLLEGLVFGARAAGAIAAGRRAGPAATAATGPERRGALAGLLAPGWGDAIPVRVMPFSQEALRHPAGAARSPTTEAGRGPAAASGSDCGELRARLQALFSRLAGVVRTESGLAEARRSLDALLGELPEPVDRACVELANLAVVGAALLEAAQARRETRGAHTRADHPATDDIGFRCRLSPRLNRPASEGS
jgi:L-aspartate oxidase